MDVERTDTDHASDQREREALEWLMSFADMERGVGWSPRADPAEVWKLGRTRALLDIAGRPDRRMRCVLVGGTKGKGSTAAFLASVLDAAGLRAGLYTQPHLQSYRERIRVAGAAIDPAAFTTAVHASRPWVSELARRHPAAGEPTTFELTTVLALRHFTDAGCAVAILEVGLGGRLDATNAVDPEISVIAPISRDHVEILGTRLELIAREKAGIMRPRRTGLIAVQRPSVARSLRSACRSVGASCRTVPPLGRGFILGIAGEHQRQNAALAVAAAKALGVTDDRAIQRGLERVRWPGRFEEVRAEPPIILDGAHNDASANALAATLRQRYRRTPIQLVVGMYRDKDARAILRPLLPLASRVWATQPRGPRQIAAAELAAICRSLGGRAVQERDDVRAALIAAQAADGPICVTGSLALVGEARDALGLPAPERLWD